MDLQDQLKKMFPEHVEEDTPKEPETENKLWIQ